MNSLVRDDATRAATFFGLAFGLTVLGGLAIGDLRVGVQYGFPLGLVFAVFAYFFLVPTALDEDGAADVDDAEVDDGAADGDGDADSDVASEAGNGNGL